jgi:TonB family protein
MSISPTLRGTGMGVVPERRACQRRSVMDRRLVTVNLDNTDAGLMVDISEAGMAVQALARIKQGATTSLQFELPDTATRIEAKGTVAWVDTTSGRAGIRFQNLDEAAAASLKQWLDSQPLQKAPAGSPVAPAVSSVLGPESKVAAIASLQREITSRGLDTDAALALIAERARGLTRGDGAAIAVGDSKFMTCRASSGSAPPVGAALQPDSGLSGECVRTGMTVRCEDTELDPRVDRDACRALKLRSAIIVPLFARGNISGLVEIFYSSPRGFEGRDVLTLRRMADLICATLYAPVSRLADALGTPASAAAVQQPPNPEPLRATPALPMIPPVPGVLAKSEKVVCDVCGHENPSTLKDCEKCDVPLPGRLQQEQAHAAGADFVAERQGIQTDLTLPQSEAAAQRRRIVLRLPVRGRVLFLIAALLVGMSLFGWRRLKPHRANAAPPVTTTSTAELPMTVAAVVPTSSSEISFQPTGLRSSMVPVGRSTGTTAGVKGRPPLTQAKDVIASNMVPAKSAVTSSAAALTMPSARPPETQGVAPPPLAATTPTPIVATILSPPATAPKLVATPGTATVSPSRLLSRVEPVYPKLAMASRVQGAVVLKASILRNGRLGQIQVVSGNDLLVGAAVHAVQQWRYKPMELDGKPVDSETTIKINFSLGTAR